MSPTSQTFQRWFLLPAVLVGAHTLIVLGALTVGGFAHDRFGHAGISGTVWDLFAILDYPGSTLVWKHSALEPLIFFLCLGIIQWGLIGLVIQFVWRWFRKEKADA